MTTFSIHKHANVAKKKRKRKKKQYINLIIKTFAIYIIFVNIFLRVT